MQLTSSQLSLGKLWEKNDRINFLYQYSAGHSFSLHNHRNTVLPSHYYSISQERLDYAVVSNNSPNLSGLQKQRLIFLSHYGSIMGQQQLCSASHSLWDPGGWSTLSLEHRWLSRQRKREHVTHERTLLHRHNTCHFHSYLMAKASRKAKPAIKGVRIHNSPIGKGRKYWGTIMYPITVFSFDQKNQSFHTYAPQISIVLLKEKCFFLIYFLLFNIVSSVLPFGLYF